MLSLFPQLLDYGVVTVTALRFITGLFFLFQSYEILQKRKDWKDAILSSAGIVSSFALFLGFLTQVAAALLALIAAKLLYSGYKNHSDFISKRYYFLLFILAVSFLFLGPGILGFDYPL